MRDYSPRAKAQSHDNPARQLDWRRSMSDHVAYALLVYTGLQIFVTVHALKDGLSSTVPYFALIILVAGIIPACRWFERRWIGLSDAEAANPEYREAFRRDITWLWVMAISLPLILTGLFKAIFSFV